MDPAKSAVGDLVVPCTLSIVTNRVFFPQSAMDQWGLEGKVDLVGGELVLLREGRRYSVEEALYVVTEVTGVHDELGLVGKVKGKSQLETMGAEILEGSMIVGDNAYEVVPGWLGEPADPFGNFVETRTSSNAFLSDEELLHAFANVTREGQTNHAP